ncbi:MAG: hypothetical protein IPM56_05905 [Ignavibacteriales bacterium]|nr:MAG: hypothetical protein IPM56_05905 [Ignavibacteriales bacterium]
MKKQALILIVFLFLIPVTGCYTVVWEPDMDFPDESNSEVSYDNYYDGQYYGHYDYFYNYPWWLSITPPTKERTIDRDKNPAINTLRNDGGGRVSGNSRNPNEVLTTPPPTRDGSSQSSNGNSNSGNTDRTIQTDNTNRTNNSGSSQNSTRNNDGNRNSDGKRR